MQNVISYKYSAKILKYLDICFFFNVIRMALSLVMRQLTVWGWKIWRFIHYCIIFIGVHDFQFEALNCLPLINTARRDIILHLTTEPPIFCRCCAFSANQY